ncbi:MAG TPA: hypothetical protein VHA78_03195 [Candidatus Peribacteraceae bacterium]|nr:hypothetical protein [Candidatus Peribacteraceae bacterium]
MRSHRSRPLGFESLEDRTVMNATNVVAADLQDIRDMQQKISNDAAAITSAQMIVNNAGTDCGDDNALVVNDMKTLNSDSALRDAEYAKLRTLHSWQISYWQTWARYQADCATVAADIDWLRRDEAVLRAAQNRYADDLSTLHVAEATHVQDVKAFETEKVLLAHDVLLAANDPSTAVFDRAILNNLPQSLTLESGGSFMETFSLTEEKILNLSLLHDLTNPLNNRSAQLTLLNAQTGEIIAQSMHAGMSGNAVSCRLEAGMYSFVITTDAAIPTIGTPPLPTRLQWTADLEPVSMRSIKGSVSIDGNPHVFSVGMTCVHFVDGKRMETDIDPSKPVWLVIHGRADNPFSGKFDDLERELCATGSQVIACDWSGPAADNMPQLIGLEGQDWIPAVGAAFNTLLQTWSITGANMNIAAHSWGTFVGYEIARHYKEENGEGVQAFVALDPAVDPPMTGYDASQINFAAVSNASWALHSSIFGSDAEALTANETFEIRSDALNPVSAHGLAVTTFASLIRLQEIDPANGIAEQFNLAQLNQTEIDAVHHKQPDGWLWVSSDAVLQKFSATNPDDAVPDHYLFSTLTTLDETILSSHQ